MLGSTVDGKYRVVRLLGQGGMGAVYEAIHNGTGRRVALKVILGEFAITQDALARFQREARAAGAIESQHIVQVLDTGIDRELGVPFMVMEYLVGEDLQKLCERLGPLPADLALRIVAQACSGLQKAHEASVVHRDIKPANLYLARRDDNDIVVRLLDFGIAKVKQDQLAAGVDTSLTRTGSMLGSPLYMSPEQAMGLKTIDHRSDIWSLGAVLYEALSGKTPHHGSETLGQLIMAICTTRATPIQQVAPWLAPEVAEIVHRALRLEPAERFSSAEEMRASIRRLLPNGSALNEELLVALPESAKSSAAPAYQATAEERIPPASVVSPRHSESTASIQSATADPFTSTAARPPKTKAALLVGLSVVVTVLGAGLWFAQYSRGPAVDATKTPSPLASPASLTALPDEASRVAQPSITPAARSVRLQIAPTAATVDVDGTRANVQDGFLELQGTLGSVHTVRVQLGTRATTVDVLIGDSGAVPPRVELTSTPPSKPSPRTEPSAKPASVAKTPTPAATTTPAKPASTPQSRGLTVDKNFE